MLNGNNLAKFNCKIGILLKNPAINKEEFALKIRENSKLNRYEGLTFSASFYPSDVVVELKNGLFFLN